MTIWFDVEDLFEFLAVARRPTGVQRLCLEVYAAAAASGRPVGFVRYAPGGGGGGDLVTVAWEEVAAVGARLTAATTAPGAATAGALAAAVGPRPLLQGAPRLRASLKAVARAMPPEMRGAVGEAARAQAQALGALARAARATPRAARTVLDGRWGRRAAPRTDGARPGRPLAAAAAPGDTLVLLGASWLYEGYAARIARHLSLGGARAGAAGGGRLRFATLLYDMIPLVRPEFCHPDFAGAYEAGLRATLPLADAVMAISRSAADDAEAWCAREGVALRAGRPTVLPIGGGFATGAAAAPGGPQALPAGLEPGGYALFVSSIEARKNHALAFRAWRRLLDELPRDAVPTLVFAGQVGWMVDDLLQQIRNAGALGGKVVHVAAPSDAALAALYRGARFTLFPSHYEGWGLPVTESLSFGKVCLAAATSSLPEAGGELCLYHDPDCVRDAAALYRRAIVEPGLIAGLEARIAAEHRVVPWSATFAALAEALGERAAETGAAGRDAEPLPD